MNTSSPAEPLFTQGGEHRSPWKRRKTARQHNPCVIMTSNGLVQANRDATVYINDLDIFLCVRLFEDSPAVLSLGMSCEVMGFSYFWNAGEQPSLTKDGVSTKCRSDNHVPVVAVTTACAFQRRRRLFARLDFPSELSRYRSEYQQLNEELIDAQNVTIGTAAEFFLNAQWMVSMAWCVMWCSLASMCPLV